MSRVLTRIDQIQDIVVANIGRSNPLIRSQGGPGVAEALRSTGREAGAIALPFGSHPKALSPQRLGNLLRLRQSTPKMDYSCQNPHGVPQGFRSCQMRGRPAVLRCLRRVRHSEEQGPGFAGMRRGASPSGPPSRLGFATLSCPAGHPAKPSVRPCGT